MKRFPHHQFAASSGQHYAWLEELYPSLFESVSEYVTSDRFHHVGGSWVEHDCLLPSGESLCRQYLFGQRYFESKFGRRCREAWLPDTFGYASQLPQILRLAGMDYFFTQKVTHDSFASDQDIATIADAINFDSYPGTTSTPSLTPLSIGVASMALKCFPT